MVIGDQSARAPMAPTDPGEPLRRAPGHVRRNSGSAPLSLFAREAAVSNGGMCGRQLAGTRPSASSGSSERASQSV